MVSMLISQTITSMLVILQFARKTAADYVAIVAGTVYRNRYWVIRIISSGVVLTVAIGGIYMPSILWSPYSSNVASDIALGFIFGFIGLVVCVHILIRALDAQDDIQVLAIVIGINAMLTIIQPLLREEQMRTEEIIFFFGAVIGAICSIMTIRISKALTNNTRLEWLDRAND